MRVEHLGHRRGALLPELDRLQAVVNGGGNRHALAIQKLGAEDMRWLEERSGTRQNRLLDLTAPLPQSLSNDSAGLLERSLSQLSPRSMLRIPMPKHSTCISNPLSPLPRGSHLTAPRAPRKSGAPSVPETPD